MPNYAPDQDRTFMSKTKKTVSEEVLSVFLKDGWHGLKAHMRAIAKKRKVSVSTLCSEAIAEKFDFTPAAKKGKP